jgi:acetyl esterase/lipase
VTKLNLCLIALICSPAPAQTAPPLKLWPAAAPGDSRDAGPERLTPPEQAGGLVAGKPIIRLGNVTTPTLTVYKPAPEKDNGGAALVFPGGGYSILAYDLEGSEICEWLNTLGMTGILVKYRVPAQPNSPRKQAPLQDAQRAISLVRHNAAKWKIDPRRIGVIGFSAGGHLAANLSNNYSLRTYDTVDEADSESMRPDFAMLIYPAYLVGPKDENLAPEMKIGPQTPPTFLIQAENDGVRVENSLVYYAALRKAKVPAEMHLYSEGGHGYGLRPNGLAITSWPVRASEWLARTLKSDTAGR